MSIAAVQNTSTATGASASASNSVSAASNQFLKLLVTQMQNQDPMNPMDNAQITSQLAQLSTVQGITDLNTTVSGLVSQLQSSQMMQSASLIGQNVLAQGSVLNLGSAGAAGGVNLASAADQVSVNVLNSAGKVIRSLSLGSQPAGLAQFTWDGKDASGSAQAVGNFNFQVAATAAGTAVTATPYALAQVQSVSSGSSGLNVQLSNLGTVGMNQIIQIF